MSELSDEASESELLNRSLSMWHGVGQMVCHQELDVPLDLHTAASIGQYEVVKEGIQRKEIDLNQRNCGGWTPLMYASYIGHDTIVHMLLEAGVNVNVPTPEGQTPLMLAASCGNESVASFLLQQGAELEMRDIHGWTALFHCTSAGHQQMVKFLLDNGANANCREPLCGYTPLMEAAASGHEIIVQDLLNHGVRVDVQDNSGATARTLAMTYGHMKIVGLIDLHTAPVPKILCRGPGKYEDLSSSDESYSAPQRQRPARKPKGPSIHDGPHALAKITAVRIGGKSHSCHEQVPPEGYVTFKDDGTGFEEGSLCYRDVTSPINEHDVESSSSREDNSSFTNDLATIRIKSSSSSEGLANAIGISSEGSLESNEDSDNATTVSNRKHIKSYMKAKNRCSNSDSHWFCRSRTSNQPFSPSSPEAPSYTGPQKCEEVEVLKGQVSQEQELRAVAESCLMERDVAWSDVQMKLHEVQAVTRSAGILLKQMQDCQAELSSRMNQEHIAGPWLEAKGQLGAGTGRWPPTLKVLSLPELSTLLEGCVGEMAILTSGDSSTRKLCFALESARVREMDRHSEPSAMRAITTRPGESRCVDA
ncbi:hypothetical protein JD844_019673 [Phrynosoma platyrhinos]|uniref:Ankyrin repeat and SAM domain-containing protein 3 n=1 Tax=Phrynosoma platyrhinos TaxID=52577 RepID=A0ABQ7TQS7_PHRPL|nr:hypothetical protein JD844_019673 [Phrynosoma platyrhinos]